MSEISPKGHRFEESVSHTSVGAESRRRPLVDAMTEPVFGQREIAITHHNVGDLVEDELLSRELTRRYAFRCGQGPKRGVEHPIVLVHDTGNIGDVREHIEGYLGGGVFETAIQVATPDNLAEMVGRKTHDPRERPLFVPYIRRPETDAWLKNLGVEGDVFGMDTRLVEILNNKAEIHRRAREYQIEGFQVPDFTIAPVSEMAEAAHEFVQKDVLGLYKRHNITDYPVVGLMLRGEVGSGGYSTVKVVEDRELKRTGKPYIRILADTNVHENPEYYKDWRTALYNAQTLIEPTVGKNANIVVSRLVELADPIDGSPGQTIVFVDGNAVSLGWNGQVQNEVNACIGTKNYDPMNPDLKKLQSEYEDACGEACIAFINRVAQEDGISLVGQRGFINVDWIAVGAHERELQRRRGINAPLYGVEFNPRTTNLMEARIALTEIDGNIVTINSLLEQGRKPMLALDEYPQPRGLWLPEGSDPRTIREIIFEVDQVYKQATNGNSRVINRMPTVPVMGVIFSGDYIPDARSELDRRIAGYGQQLSRK